MNHIEMAHAYWKAFLTPGDCVIDATCGNGYDSLALARLVLPEGELCCIDIQEKALKRTRERLTAALPASYFQNITLHRGCHSELPFLKPKLIVYNLGYLPGSDKSVTTKRPSTLRSLRNGLALIPQGGSLSITCYPGHPEGACETKEVFNWAHNLNFQNFNLFYYNYLNRSKSPSVILIFKS